MGKLNLHALYSGLTNGSYTNSMVYMSTTIQYMKV